MIGVLLFDSYLGLPGAQIVRKGVQNNGRKNREPEKNDDEISARLSSIGDFLKP